MGGAHGAGPGPGAAAGSTGDRACRLRSADRALGALARRFRLAARACRDGQQGGADRALRAGHSARLPGAPLEHRRRGPALFRRLRGDRRRPRAARRGIVAACRGRGAGGRHDRGRRLGRARRPAARVSRHERDPLDPDADLCRDPVGRLSGNGPVGRPPDLLRSPIPSRSRRPHAWASWQAASTAACCCSPRPRCCWSRSIAACAGATSCG